MLGLAEQLSTYPDEDSAVSEALTYCDVTTGPDGSPVELWERLDEIRVRYGAEHVRVRAQDLARPYVYLAVGQTELRLPGGVRTPPAQERTIEGLRASIEALQSSRWTRRLTLWVRDVGKIVHPYCYTTGDHLLYVHRPGWGVIAIYRGDEVVRLEELPVPERRGRRVSHRRGAEDWRVTVHVLGQRAPYVFERAQLSFAGNEGTRAILVDSPRGVRSVFQEAVVRRVFKEITGIRPTVQPESLGSMSRPLTSRCLHQRIAAKTVNGETRVFADAYSICSKDAVTVWRAPSDDLDVGAHHRLADYRYRDVRMLLGVASEARG